MLWIMGSLVAAQLVLPEIVQPCRVAGELLADLYRQHFPMEVSVNLVRLNEHPQIEYAVREADAARADR